MKNQIKYLQNLFYDLLNDYGLVYIAIKHSEHTIIGKRGFTEKEKKDGLILVFNKQNHKDLQWTEDGNIMATLGFGNSNRLEKCLIHFDDIVSVFSPEARVKFDRWDIWSTEEISEQLKENLEDEIKTASDEKIISLDRFRKKKK